MPAPLITCLFHSHATVTALLNAPAGRTLAGDLLVECSRRPSIGLMLNLETPANYPGVAGLLGGIDPTALANHSDGLPAPIILAAGEEVAVDAVRSALMLLARAHERLKNITLLVPIGAARSFGAALALGDRFAIGWDVAQFPHEELIEFARWLGGERLLERRNFAGVFAYGAEPLDPGHQKKIAMLLASLALAGVPAEVIATSTVSPNS
jgi:hypothetical protein